MKDFSLIVATINRDEELEILFESLLQQTFKDFEVIVVDQNTDGKLDAIIGKFGQNLDIKHFKVEFTGVTRARNYGISQSNGKILSFPDDDCYYENDVLEKIKDLFENYSDLSVISTGCYLPESDKSCMGKNSKKSKKITIFNFMGIEFSYFYNCERIDKKEIYYDEDFGVGSKYYAGEVHEQFFRIFKDGRRGLYIPEIQIYHPSPSNNNTLDRDYKYAIAGGAFRRKFLNRHEWIILLYILSGMVIKPLINFLIAILKLDLKSLQQYFVRFKGLWHGFFVYKESSKSETKMVDERISKPGIHVDFERILHNMSETIQSLIGVKK